ncbi:TIGR03086 family protein [Amycolatopsis acidicola]|uniref:TIGR03086 family protein n=1 Tax=Amycolatopsis acidicola TaxID=2596893 RepID=A0A5N0VAN0_9PSEU|nr:TIGR03086 family metal-binding protein [Amycolatopsis acidicola]KAA9162333.1 TIGR03086 family protein [Amycolatopsis acidicola]
MIDLKPACDRMSELLMGLTDDQLTNPTPCTEYDVAALIHHVDDGCLRFTALAQQDTGSVSASAVEPNATTPGWRDEMAQHLRTQGKAWDEPAAWQGSTDVAGLELPNERWGKISLTELVVHGWDIARATGLPFDLPERTLQACLAHVAEFVPQAPLPSLWAPPVDVAPDAPLLARIVAITGRVP